MADTEPEDITTLTELPPGFTTPIVIPSLAVMANLVKRPLVQPPGYTWSEVALDPRGDYTPTPLLSENQGGMGGYIIPPQFVQDLLEVEGNYIVFTEVASMSADLGLPAGVSQLANQLLSRWDKGDLSAGHAFLDLVEEEQRPDLLHLLSARRAKQAGPRLGIVRISFSLLTQALNLPPETEIQALGEYIGFTENQLVLRVTHPSLQPVGEGETVPEVHMVETRHSDGSITSGFNTPGQTLQDDNVVNNPADVDELSSGTTEQGEGENDNEGDAELEEDDSGEPWPAFNNPSYTNLRRRPRV